MKSIKVSDWTYEKLKELKERNGHTSFDSVIKTLMMADPKVRLEVISKIYSEIKKEHEKRVKEELERLSRELEEKRQGE